MKNMRQHWNNSKKIFLVRERFYPYTISFISISIFYILYFYGYISRVDLSNIKDFSNTMISVSSIFGSFLMASLAIILQNYENENIKLLKEKGSFQLLIRYLKEAIIFCFIVAIFSLPLSLGMFINKWYLISYLFFIVGMFSLDFRVFQLLFRTLKED